VPERLALRCDPGLDLIIAETPLPSVSFAEAAHWHPRHLNDPGLRWLLTTLVGIAQQSR
jgi:DNA-binding transcriptional LysR family regulator